MGLLLRHLSIDPPGTTNRSPWSNLKPPNQVSIGCLLNNPSCALATAEAAIDANQVDGLSGDHQVAPKASASFFIFSSFRGVRWIGNTPATGSSSTTV